MLLKESVFPSDALRLIDILGGCDVTRLVGGCVRDALMGVPVGDIDMATQFTPDEVITRCNAASLKTVPTGIDHGTVTVIINACPYEVTTLRRDEQTDGRHASIAYTDSWIEDAQRRDFTINTLLSDGRGNIIDPLGLGIADIKARQVRFVGDPQTRIAEDVLRILRFFRFYGLYGAGEADTQALAACKAMAHLIPTLSKERITQEFMKIIGCSAAPRLLPMMSECGVMPPLSDREAFASFCAAQGKYEVVDPLARLLFVDFSDLRLSNKQKAHIAAIQKALPFCAEKTEQKIKESLYFHGRSATLQAALMQNDLMNLALIDTWEIPVFPVTGETLIAQGHAAGKPLGDELKRLEREWIAAGFPKSS